MSLLNLQEIDKSRLKESLTGSAAQRVSVNESNEKARAIVRKNLWENEEIKSFRERFQSKHGFDFADHKKFPVMEDGFNWNRVAKKMGYPNATVAIKESDSGSNFPQVLRAGVQSIVNSMYLTVPVTYESWATTVNSTKDTELYAPLHGVSFLREVGKKEIYSESYAAGLDIKLVNRKYGTIWGVEKELLEDDQTGQFAKQASLLGEYCRLAAEVICYAKLAGKFTGGALAQYAQMIVPNTETQPANEANYPFTSSSAPFQGGGSNRPTSYGVLNQANVQNGFIGLMEQLNLLGLKMSVDPDTIIISPKYRFDLAVLLNSSAYPSVPSATPGAVGNTFAFNPIESIAKAVISRFVFTNTGVVSTASSAWYIIDSKKPCFVFQMRQAAEVEQENPTSGDSFNKDVIRFKCNMRGNGDWIDPRFCWQGSDGSV